MRVTREKPSKLGRYPAIFKFYEDGKGRRYNLLFAVNGGILAIAKGLADHDNKFLAGLTLRNVAIGMVVFTILMGIDIWVFGLRMREQGKDLCEDKTHGIFNWVGRGVLIAICTLMAVAWLFVASGATGPAATAARPG